MWCDQSRRPRASRDFRLGRASARDEIQLIVGGDASTQIQGLRRRQKGKQEDMFPSCRTSSDCQFKQRVYDQDCPICFTTGAGLQIRNANSHDCEKLRSEANSLRFASHKTDSTSLRFRFAIFKTRSLSLRFRNWNRLRIRRAKSAKKSFLSEYFSRFLRR